MPARLVLINDSPDDLQIVGLLSDFESHHDHILVLRNDSNLGFVKTANRGMQLAAAAGHDVLLVNSDTVTFKGTLLQLLRAARADPRIGFASPRSNNASLCSWPHHQASTLVSPEAAHARWATLGMRLPQFHFVPTAVGFYLFIAYTVIADLGLLREDFGVGYEEENDLVMRASKLGFRAVLANHAFAFHAGGASFGISGLDLLGHRQRNLGRLVDLHPDFLTLMRRYEHSPHFLAEGLLGGLLPDPAGRVSLVFDWSALTPSGNETPFPPVSAVATLARCHGQHFRVAVLCTERTFEALGLKSVPQITREEPGASGLHGIAVRPIPAFSASDIGTIDKLAPVQIFLVRDSCDEDNGPLAVAGDVSLLLDHVSAHANGLVFVSEFARQAFCRRHPEARRVQTLARLLPTRLSRFQPKPAKVESEYVLILGERSAQAAALAGEMLALAFPTTAFVLVSEPVAEATVANLTSLAAQSLAPSRLEALIAAARVVVLPSYAEGFEPGLLMALAAHRPCAVRRTPAVEEMLETFDQVIGVRLFDSNAEIVQACAEALALDSSSANDGRTYDWEAWMDEFASFCVSCAADHRVFEHLVSRCAASTSTVDSAPRPISVPDRADGIQLGFGEASFDHQIATQTDLATLLALDGRTFVAHAYATLLCRPADSAGLEFYAGQLRDGIEKLEVLRSLSISPEGRARDVRLPGLEQQISARGNAAVRLFKRLMGH
jgi:GT2 family glycosyltransferase